MDEPAFARSRRSRFRPQMVDGELVSGEGLGLRLTFQYTTRCTGG